MGLDVRAADVVTFTISSTVKNFFTLVPSIKANLASIGPVTAEMISEFGKKSDIVAREHTINGLIKAILEYYN